MAKKLHPVLHVVLHQHRRPGVLSFAERHSRWTVKMESAPWPPLVLSRIITSPGSRAVVHSGSDDYRIRKGLNRLRGPLEMGKRFKGGPLVGLAPFLSRIEQSPPSDYKTFCREFRKWVPAGQEGKQKPESGRQIQETIEEIRWTLTATPRPRKVSSHPPKWEYRGAFPKGKPSAWDRLVETHGPKILEEDRKRVCRAVGRYLATNCSVLPKGRRDRERILRIVEKRVKVGGGGSRFAYQSPKALALALAATQLDSSARTLRRWTSTL